MHYDEIHYYANQSSNGGKKLREEIDQLTTFENVDSIIGYSATPTSVWGNNIWENIKQTVYEYNDDNYVGVDSHRWIAADTNYKNAQNYAKQVLSLYPEILALRSRVFIPANRKQYTHFDMKNFLLSLNPQVVVIIINSTTRSLYYINENKKKK